MNVTGEQVKQAMIGKGITKVKVRDCSICATPLYYSRQGEDLYFNSSCGGVSYESPPQPRSWDSPAELINMQTKKEWRNKYMIAFGLEVVD